VPVRSRWLQACRAEDEAGANFSYARQAERGCGIEGLMIR
jgi:hypothetical protein